MSNVKDVKIKTVPVELDGAQFELCYDLNAFAELEEKYDSVPNALKALEKGSFKAIRTFLWAGLIRKNPELTERAVGALLSAGDLQAITPKLTEAIKLASPEAKEALATTTPYPATATAVTR